MIDIQQRFDEACRLGNLTEVKEIVQEKEFLEHSSINYNYSTGIYNASDNNQLDIIKYLLEEKELKKHVSINFENNCILKTACRQNFFNVINYLILEYKMKITTDVLMPNYQNSDYVMALYQKRLLNNTLQKKLPEKQIKIKGLKI